MSDISNIKVLVLVDGVEVIGIISNPKDENGDTTYSNADQYICIQAALKLERKYTPTANGKTNIEVYLTRWLPFTDDEYIPIRRDRILTAVTPNKDMLDYYLERGQELNLLYVEGESDRGERQLIDYLANVPFKDDDCQ